MIYRSALLMLLMLAAVAGGGYIRAAAAPHYGGSVGIAFAQNVDSFDPALASNQAEQSISRLVYETLTNLDENGEASPALADSWKPESPRRWSFHIRTDILMHSNTPLSSGVVRTSLERVVSGGHSAVAAALRGAQLLCASPDPDRFVCDSAQPLPALPAMLADPSLAISDEAGAGTGPWRLMPAGRTHARLEAFDPYWQGRPFLNAVEVDFGVDARRARVDFELKRVDAIAPLPIDPRLPGIPRVSRADNVLVLAFAPALGNSPTRRPELPPELRRQFLRAVNRDAMTALLPGGRAETADGFLPGWLSGYDMLFAPPAGAVHITVGPLTGRPYKLIFDDSDTVARLAASRLKLDFRFFGPMFETEALPRALFVQKRDAREYDLVLDTVRLHTRSPGAALAEIVHRFGLRAVPVELFGAEDAPAAAAQYQYELEQSLLKEARALPLIHYSDVYAVQPGLQLPLARTGLLDLSNAWK